MESIFSQTMTLAAFKESCKAQTMAIVNSKKEGIAFFACGNERGYVSKKLKAQLESGEDLSSTELMVGYREVAPTPERPNGFKGWTLYAQSNADAICIL